VITVSVSVVVRAPRDVVWAAVERIETHVEWMKDAETIAFESVQERGVGTAFACRTRVGPLATTDHFVVTRWEPPALMGIEHRGAVKGDADFTLGDRGDGTTDFGWEERLRFPWWLGGPLGERVGRPVLARVWQGNLERLAARIESA